MKLIGGYLYGAHCPLCGSAPCPTPHGDWFCMECGSYNVRMKFKYNPSIQQLIGKFNSYLCQLGHKVDLNGWKGLNFDLLHKEGSSEYYDTFETICCYDDCKALFEVSLLKELEQSYALWYNYQNISIGYANKEITIKSNMNHYGHRILPQQFVCKRLEIMK